VLRDDSKEIDWEHIGKQSDTQYDFKARRVLRGHLGKVYAMQCGSGPKLVSASQDGKLIVWNADLDTKLNLVSLKMAWVMTCAFDSATDEMVACGGLDNVCSVYRLKAPGSTINRPEVELRGHDGYLSSCRFLPGGQILTASGDSTCIIWDIARREKLRDFSDHGGDVMR
jgi:guanine nucleotide-binding protein G(I)/G(S)/G(T) subunit beta-1